MVEKNDSAMALSHASPIDPMEPRMPAARRRRPNAQDVYRVDIKTGRVDALGSMGHATAEGEGIDATPLSSGLLHTLTVVPRNTAWFDHFKARKV